MIFKFSFGRDTLSLLGKELEGFLASLFVTNSYVFRLFASYQGISNQLLSLGFIDLIISRLDGSVILCSAIKK
jgi:hypothetical protein